MNEVLILSSVRWNFTWQRHQALAAAAAELGNVVTFVEPAPRRLDQIIKYFFARLQRRPVKSQENEVPDNVFVMSYLRFLRLTIKRRISRSNGYSLVIFYVPSVLTLITVWLARCKSSVYDSVLDWQNAPKDWFAPRSSTVIERYIGRSARHGNIRLVSDSRAVVEKYRRRSIECLLVEPAADQPFIDYRWTAGRPRLLGYFGSVRETEIDIDALSNLVSSGYDLEIAGPVDGGVRSRLVANGVIFHQSMPVSDLVAAVDRWCAVLLPYKMSARTSTLVPAKLWNCLSTGKVVYISGLSLPSSVTILEEPSRLPGFSAIRLQSADQSLIPNWHERFQMISEGEW